MHRHYESFWDWGWRHHSDTTTDWLCLTALWHQLTSTGQHCLCLYSVCVCVWVRMEIWFSSESAWMQLLTQTLLSCSCKSWQDGLQRPTVHRPLNNPICPSRIVMQLFHRPVSPRLPLTPLCSTWSRCFWWVQPVGGIIVVRLLDKRLPSDYPRVKQAYHQWVNKWNKFTTHTPSSFTVLHGRVKDTFPPLAGAHKSSQFGLASSEFCRNPASPEMSALPRRTKVLVYVLLF